MTQPFGIDRGKLKSKYNNLMRLSTDAIVGTEFEIQALAVRNVIDSLVPIESEKKEECIHNDCLQDEDGDICIAPQKEKKCPQCGNNMANAISAYICSKCFVKITKNQQKQQKEKKEERCTKCNGTGKLDTVRSLTITCGACNGTGKEPRKEELPVSFSTPEDALRCAMLMANAEAKLSRYKEALWRVLGSKGFEEMKDIARTALEDTNH